MKRLYMIFILLFMASCGGSSNPDDVSPGQVRPTIPPEWLTKPPTAETTSVKIITEQASVEEPFNTPTLRAEIADPTITPTAVQVEPTSTETATPFIVPTKELGRQLSITINPDVPGDLIRTAKELVEFRPNDFTWLEPGSASADITLAVGEGTQLADWVYVVAAPFATIEEDISLEGIQSLWQNGDNEERSLVIDTETAATFTNPWGAPDTSAVIVDKENLLNSLWGKRPSLTILPFNQLTPAYKIISVNQASPLSPVFNLEGYPLLVSVGVIGDADAVSDFLTAWPLSGTNYDPAKITKVAMTGVTALVRATASQMEIDGILTPAEDVGAVLKAADITHISNEVSFSPDCPEPNPVGGTTFCSQDDYFALLSEIGADVIELTGNHINDWGPDSVIHTIDMYERANMAHFGGGLDDIDAALPALFEHNDNKIAFLGCNPVGPNYAWASATTPGSSPCDPDFEAQIRRLADQGYVVIATQQYYEFYHYEATDQQKEDFRVLVDAGASAVSGSQGHHAQGFDLYNDAFIHYGLGNLFFDQMDMLGTRQTFVDTYTIYDGRLINVELWTGLIEDYFKPRLMTSEEREALLETVFEASGW